MFKKIFFSLFAISLISASLATPYWKPPKGSIALTYDDGPYPRDTRAILDILREKHAHATFYVLSNFAKNHPQYLRRMMKEGDSVANHSVYHPNLTKISTKKLHYQVFHSKKVIDNIIGAKVRCFRPPFGMARKREKEMIRRAGMHPVPIGWNSFDYTRPGCMQIVKNVMKGIRMGQRVILLHDGPKRRDQTVCATRILINRIRARGYKLAGYCYPKKA